MSLADTIQTDLVRALKSRDVETLSVLRMVVSSLKNSQIDKHTNTLTDDEVIAQIQRQIKQRRESVDFYLKGSRNDLADKEAREIDILSKYLPQQLDRLEIENLVDRIISESGPDEAKNFGLLMKKIIEAVKGRADGRIVAEIVKERLS